MPILSCSESFVMVTRPFAMCQSVCLWMNFVRVVCIVDASVARFVPTLLHMKNSIATSPFVSGSHLFKVCGPDEMYPIVVFR